MRKLPSARRMKPCCVLDISTKLPITSPLSSMPVTIVPAPVLMFGASNSTMVGLATAAEPEQAKPNASASARLRVIIATPHCAIDAGPFRRRETLPRESLRVKRYPRLVVHAPSSGSSQLGQLVEQSATV